MNGFDSNLGKETIREGKKGKSDDDLKPQICIMKGTIKNHTLNILSVLIAYKITTLLPFGSVLYEFTFDFAICFQTGPQSSVSFKYKYLVYLCHPSLNWSIITFISKPSIFLLGFLQILNTTIQIIHTIVVVVIAVGTLFCLQLFVL